MLSRFNLRRRLAIEPITVAFSAFLAFATLSGCNLEQEESPPSSRTFTLRIAHSPELAGFIAEAKRTFLILNPALPDGAKVIVETVAERSADAANKIATGELKVEAWLASSSALINLANQNVRNLGAQQSECVQLFGSPVVLAAPPEKAGLISDNQMFSWARVNESLQGSNSPRVRLSHPNPGGSDAGLAATEQLFRFSSGTNEPDVSSNWSDKTASKMRELEKLVWQRAEQSTTLLNRVSSSGADPLHLALTTERETIQFNSSKTTHQKVSILYSTAPTVWLDYNLCRAESDWISAEQKIVYALFKRHLSSEAMQRAATVEGFRPSITKRVDPKIFGAAIGVNLNMPTISAGAPSAEFTREMFANWSDLLPPAHIAVVIDSSASMEGAALLAVKDSLRELFARLPARVTVSMITFSTEPTLKVGPTQDMAAVIMALDPLEPQGGSAVFDGVKLGLDTLKSPEPKTNRPILIFITDGEAGNSEIPQASIERELVEAANSIGLHVIGIGIKQGTENFQPLRQLTESADGVFKETPLGGLPQTLGLILETL
jgi:uncharacterized protein YegL